MLPNEEIPVGNSTRSYAYGQNMWLKMFNPRQQLAHGHCVETFRECVDEDQAFERLEDRRKAAWCYIALAFDKMLHRNCLLARWDPGKNIIASAFDTHDFGFKWSYAEMAVSGEGYGLEWAVNDVKNCISDLLEMTGQAENPTKADQSGTPEANGSPITGNQW